MIFGHATQLRFPKGFERSLRRMGAEDLTDAWVWRGWCQLGWVEWGWVGGVEWAGGVMRGSAKRQPASE